MTEFAVSVRDLKGDARGILTVTGDLRAKPHGVSSSALNKRLVKQHVQRAPMDGVLRPVVSGFQPARFCINLTAIQTDKGPFLRRHPHLVERLFIDPKIEQLAHRVRLKVDANTQRAHFASGFHDKERHADLMQRQAHDQTANTASGDQNPIVSHGIRFPCHAHMQRVYCNNTGICTGPRKPNPRQITASVSGIDISGNRSKRTGNIICPTARRATCVP